MEQQTDNYVTDKKYYMDKRLKYYLDLIINEKISKESEDDALIICEGDEGTGKSSMAGHIGYYIASKTGRAFSGKTFHLNTDEMMKFASTTYRQIICWDEPAVSGMSDEWWNKEQRKLKKMLTLIRQHQHLYIFNFARFNKFSEFFIVERSIAMIKTFKKNRMEHGHFMYFNTIAKEQLFNDWKLKRLRNYQQHCVFVGRFFTPLSLFLTPEEYSDYKKRKDQAVIDLVNDEEKPNKEKEELIRLRYQISLLNRKALQNVKSNQDISIIIGIPATSLARWRKYPQIFPKLFKSSNKNDNLSKEIEQTTTETDTINYNSLNQAENDVDDNIGLDTNT